MSLCTTFSTSPVCFNVTATNVKSSLIAHYEYGRDANDKVVLVSTRYTTADGVVVDTSVGTLTVGACAVPSPDVEYVTLCDVNAAGVATEFIRRSTTSFDASGIPTVVVVDLQADLVTPYVPTGTVGVCKEDCDAAVPVGVLTTWGV